MNTQRYYNLIRTINEQSGVDINYAIHNNLLEDYIEFDEIDTEEIMEEMGYTCDEEGKREIITEYIDILNDILDIDSIVKKVFIYEFMNWFKNFTEDEFELEEEEW